MICNLKMSKPQAFKHILMKNHSKYLYSILPQKNATDKTLYVYIIYIYI